MTHPPRGDSKTCTDIQIPGSKLRSRCKARQKANKNVGPSYPQGLSVVAPAPAALVGLWVVATNNKEDVLATHVGWDDVYKVIEVGLILEVILQCLGLATNKTLNCGTPEDGYRRPCHLIHDR